MPKKFKGENSKAAEARARKVAAKDAAEAKKQQEIEDAYWEDNDKHVVKKQQRKEDKEKKKLELLEKKKEIQRLLDEEQSNLKSAAKKEAAKPAKVTQIEAEAYRKAAQAAESAAASKEKDKVVVVDEQPLEENINRLVVEGEEARTVEEALSVLSAKDDDIDLHPEKRVKAAYLAYEEKNLPIVKAENPGLRLSQLKQIIRKNWSKSPENPLIQQAMTAK